eukprot:gene16289-21329_t
MLYYNDINIAKTHVACPTEAYVFQPGVGCDPTVKGKAGCGTMDFSKALADPADCLAKAGQAEGGATHTFVYNGEET